MNTLTEVNLLTVALDYPTDADPFGGAFVHVLMRDMRRLGAKPMVICPQKVVRTGSRRIGLSKAPTVEVREGVKVFRPRYLPFSNKKLPLGISTFRWTIASFDRAVRRASRSVSMRPDLCYGHFLYPSGLAASHLAERLGTASVVALGESSFDHYEDHLGIGQVRADLSRFRRVLVVSEATRGMAIDRYRVPEDRVVVVHNAAADYFRPLPRDEMRRKLGLPVDRPVVAFVGYFSENKGPHRVLQAIEGRPDIGAVFLGRGPKPPVGSQILFRGLVPHLEVPEWLSAADILVQPVSREGSSNAIHEALACGLPVVSSDIPVNREILDPSVAVLVDPTDIVQLGAAIRELIDDPDKRCVMGAAALDKARGFRSIDRARRILDWLDGLRDH